MKQNFSPTKMKSAQQYFVLHLIIVFLLIGTVAVMWDGWWHLAVGRDSFWILPHLLLYSTVGLASQFLELNFRFSFQSVLIAITMAGMGGLLGGLVINHIKFK